MEEILKQILSEVKDLKQDVGEVKGLRQDVQGLKQDVGGLQQDVQGLKQDVGGLQQDVQGLKQDVGVLKQDVQGLKEDIGELKTSAVKLETRIENEVIEKIRALFDAREVQQDTNQRIISTLDRIEAKVDVLQLETAHIRRVK